MLESPLLLPMRQRIKNKNGTKITLNAPEKLNRLKLQPNVNLSNKKYKIIINNKH